MSKVFVKINTTPYWMALLGYANVQTMLNQESDRVIDFLPEHTIFIGYITLPTNYGGLSQYYELEFENSFYKQDVDLHLTYRSHTLTNQDPSGLISNAVVITIEGAASALRAVQSGLTAAPVKNALHFTMKNIKVESLLDSHTHNGCSHEAVDVGFHNKNMVCKHCNKDMN